MNARARARPDRREGDGGFQEAPAPSRASPAKKTAPHNAGGGVAKPPARPRDPARAAARGAVERERDERRDAREGPRVDPPVTASSRTSSCGRSRAAATTRSSAATTGCGSTRRRASTPPPSTSSTSTTREARLLAQTLNRTRGKDDPERYADLLRRILEDFAPADITQLLPETEQSIAKLVGDLGGPDADLALPPPPEPRSRRRRDLRARRAPPPVRRRPRPGRRRRAARRRRADAAGHRPALRRPPRARLA